MKTLRSNFDLDGRDLDGPLAAPRLARATPGVPFAVIRLALLALVLTLIGLAVLATR